MSLLQSACMLCIIIVHMQRASLGWFIMELRDPLWDPPMTPLWISLQMLVVYSGTIASNFSLVSSLNPNPTKLCNSSHKGMSKGCVVCCKEVDNVPCSGVCEQTLVRSKQPSSLLKVLVVHVIESLRRAWVQCNCSSWVYVFRTLFPEAHCIIQIHRRINSVLAFEIVYSVVESVAV